MGDWVNRIWKAIFSGLIQGAVRTWLWPIVLTGIPIALLWLQGQRPLVGYFAIAVLFTFTCSIWAVVGVSRWHFSRNPADKLVFLGSHIAADRTNNGQNLDAVQISMRLKNDAEFPISYRVEKIRTSVDNTLPALNIKMNMGGVVVPGAETLFRDNGIKLKIPMSVMGASLEAELVYGRPGAEKYKMSVAQDITIRFGPSTGQITWNWFDLPV